MSFVYWLGLENGKFYVGRTADLKRRIGEHFLGEGAKWTKINKPHEVLGYTKELNNLHEDYMTLLMMKKHGVDNVRGGRWCMQFMDQRIKGQLTSSISYIVETLSIEENMNRINNVRIDYISSILSLGSIDKTNFSDNRPLWDELVSYKKCVKCRQTHEISFMKPYCYHCWEEEFKKITAKNNLTF